MSYLPFLVANFRVGLQQNVDPWLVPEEAVTELCNMYLQNGVYCKRPGVSIIAQLGTLCTFKAVADTSSSTPNAFKNPVLSSDQLPFIPHSVRVYDTGTGAFLQAFDDGRGSFKPAFINSSVASHVNYATGEFEIYLTSAPIGDLYVDVHLATDQPTRFLGNLKRTDEINLLVAIGAKRLSSFRATTRYFANVANSQGAFDVFSGSNTFSSCEYLDTLWLCDNSILSSGVGGVKCFDGNQVIDPTLNLNDPSSANAVAIKGALLCFVYKERIVLLNTVEGSQNRRYAQRARYSAPGVLPTTATGWFDAEFSGVFNQGGRNDAPTNEAIVTAGFVGETLIVGFESSVYALDATPSPSLPFAWRKITDGKRMIAPHGAVKFDDFVMLVGQDGLFSCDGNRVARMDQRIPNFVYNFSQSAAPKIYAYRCDYLQQMLLAYPSLDSLSNDKILVYNFSDNAYSTYNLSAQVMSSYLSDHGKTFGDFYDKTFADLANMKWGDPGFGAQFPSLLIGQQGGVICELNNEYTTDQTSWDQKRGLAPSQRFNFLLRTKRFNPFIDKGMRTQLGYVELLCDASDETEFCTDFTLNHDSYLAHSQVINMSETSEGTMAWARADAFLTGNFVQMDVHLSDEQLAGSAGKCQVNIHGLNFYFRPMGKFS